MRTVIIMAAGLATASAGAADAQRVVTRGPGAGYPVPGRGGPAVNSHPHGPVVGQPAGSRWGSRVNGRWWGGANAPGGWAAYRRPVRGYALPPYWTAQRFYVADWNTYGLRQPASGYRWVRYYDDAVLIDGRGSVWDSVSGLDWDRYDGGDNGYAPGYADGGYADDRGGGERRDNGLGGAAIGAVAGGVAGNLIAGRGNRLGGTLIGAGVGAAAGYAIDKAEDRGRYQPPVAPPPGAHYPPPPGYYDDDRGYPPPPPVVHAGPGRADWVSPDGRTTVTTSSGGGGYWGGGSTTTVVVQSAPVVTTTTTTTEIIEDYVTYTRAPVKKVRSWKPKTRCHCR